MPRWHCPKQALACYQALPREDKHTFLSKFQKSRRDLSWVRSFKQEDVHNNGYEDKRNSGMRTRAEILHMNGYNTSMMEDDEAIKLSDGLMTMSQHVFGYPANKITNEDNDMLSLYAYVKDGGRDHMEGRSTSSR